MSHDAIGLHAYHAWANDRVLAHLATLPAETSRTEVRSVFPTIDAVLAHIYVIDRGWLAMMGGTPFAEAAAASLPLIEETRGMRLPELTSRMTAQAAEFRAFLDARPDVTASHAIGALAMTIADMMQHVVIHGSYHRGNITAMLHQLEYRGVPTDFGFYLYTLTA